MTHRHYKFWRDAKDGKVYSHALCGVDVHVETFKSEMDFAFREMLKENWNAANRSFVRTDTIDPLLVMETTAAPSDCDECESLFGLTVLGAVA
jgi:hypothetical protein